MPATIPMPMVWQVRIAGNAQIVGASRIHELTGVASSHMKNRSMPSAQCYPLAA
jgi:hypothetical protein